MFSHKNTKTQNPSKLFYKPFFCGILCFRDLVAFFLIMFNLCSSISLTAQFSCYPSRYITKIFDSVQVLQDVKYGEAPKWYWPYSTEELFLDIYLPFGDSLQKRPLLILVHGGGFMVGDKTTQDIVAFCDSFARKGYVTASIEYRKGYNPLSSGDIERAAYRGTQDGKAAVRFLKAFADSFNIDTNHVFSGGHSSGAFIALHVGYQDKESERMASTYNLNFFTPDLGCLDCSGNTYPHSSRIHGVIDMSGALFDSAYIETSNDPPLIVFHGDQDDKVPFNKGKIFTLPTAPEGHGALPIVNQAQDVGLYHEFFPFYGQGHDYHKDSTGAPTTPYWDTVMNATTAFLYNLIKPNTSDIAGNSSVCQNDTVIYQLVQHLNAVYCWQVSGGSITTTDSNKIVVVWDSVGAHAIYAAEVNEIGCVGDTQTLIVNVHAPPAAWFGYVLVGQTVVFTDSSANAVQWQWDFGDGNISNLQNPSHSFPAEGSYDITLTIVDSNGCTGQTTQTINVNPTGINNQSSIFNFQLKVYPNPAGRQITCEIRNVNDSPLLMGAGSKDSELLRRGCSQITFEIINILGQTLYHETIEPENYHPTLPLNPGYSGELLPATIIKNIDLEDYDEGIYIIRVFSRLIFITQRLVVLKSDY